MPSAQDFDFEGLYGVTEERTLNFWTTNLQEAMGSERWAQIRDSTGVYLASVMGHFCLQPLDRNEILSPDYTPADTDFRQFADLTQIAELMMRQLTSARNPLWMECLRWLFPSGRRATLSLSQLDHTIDCRRRSEAFHFAARPPDLNTGKLRLGAEAEVKAEIARRVVTGPAAHLVYPETFCRVKDHS